MTPALWALTWYDPIFVWLRLCAAVGAAVCGWLVAGPVCRIIYRAAFAKPTPRWLVYVSKPAGGALLACLVYFLLPLGFGGGPGWGLGAGPGPGGGKESKGLAESESGKDRTSAAKEAAKRDVLEIELIGGDRYKNDDKFYLVRREEPPVTIKEVEDIFEKNPGRLEVHIILTLNSVGQSHPAVQRLRRLAHKYKMSTQETLPSP